MEHSFQLTAESGLPSSGPYLLSWNDATFALKDSQGAVILETETSKAHRLVDLAELYVEDKVSLAGEGRAITFKVHRAAGRAVRELVKHALRNDPEYRAEQKEIARKRLPLGIGMFLGFGSLFAVYCWILVAFDDKHVSPPGWLKALGALIHLVGIGFLGLGLAGFVVVWYAVRQSIRIARIERGL